MENTSEENPVLKAMSAILTACSRFHSKNLFRSKAVLPWNVLRNLSDKLYLKRKKAALKVESIVRQLSRAGDHARIDAIIAMLSNDLARSSRANHCKGGLIGLAGAAMGLDGAAPHLQKILPPVLELLRDGDSCLRYHACEALYHVVKASGGNFVLFFRNVFEALCQLSADPDADVQSAARLVDALCKEIVIESGIEGRSAIQELVPSFVKGVHAASPSERQFVVGWIAALGSAPDVDMLAFLPDLLDGLFSMLSDPTLALREQAAQLLRELLQATKAASQPGLGLQPAALTQLVEALIRRAGSPEEGTRLTAITWICRVVKRGGPALLPHYAPILDVVLPCTAHEDEKIRAVAQWTSEQQRDWVGLSCIAEGLAIEAVLVVVNRELSSGGKAARVEALRWLSVLLNWARPEVLALSDNGDILLSSALMEALSDDSDEVALPALAVLADVAEDLQHFRRCVLVLTRCFKKDRTLLRKRGASAVRQLCQRLGAKRVYREMAAALEEEEEDEFVAEVVQVLHLLLLSAAELAEVRALLQSAWATPQGRELWRALQPSWRRSPGATVSLCLLAQAYDEASSIISSLGEEGSHAHLVVPMDTVLHLLKSHGRPPSTEEPPRCDAAPPAPLAPPRPPARGSSRRGRLPRPIKGRRQEAHKESLRVAGC